jgi:hypothetical protein
MHRLAAKASLSFLWVYDVLARYRSSWREIRQRDKTIAARHARICAYPDASEWLREEEQSAVKELGEPQFSKPLLSGELIAD